MATRSMTLPTQEQTAQPCPCGCAPCEETCCNLDCLVQPRFFCGQLLTDQDLMALLGWTQDKLRLTRYRHGWGVVCGLEVRCDPTQAGRVVVGPGYAVSCCGDDIIVCEDTPFDLSDACREEKDPCADLRRPGDEVRREKTRFAGREAAAREVRAVDLYLRYREEPADPQTAFGRSVCKEVAECEYSRTQEVFSLAWQPAAIGSDPLTAAATRWHEAYAKCLDVVVRFRSRFTSLTGQGEDVRRWLLRWIDEQPLHQFCFIRDRICDMSAEDLATEAKVVEVLFWLVQDCRNHFLACDCHSCQEDHGVPLARVWLQANEARSNDFGRSTSGRCSILGIDAYPPYRRPISHECWPAPLGQVNVGRTIWHRWEEACTTLADLGVRVAGQEAFTLPATLAELENVLDCSLFVPCDEPRVVQIYDAEELGRRVVGFCGGSAPAPEIGVSVVKHSREVVAQPGRPVTYAFQVQNTGAAPLTITVEDDLLGVVASGVNLNPSASQTFLQTFTVPAGTTGELRNTVKVAGKAADGRTVTATDDHVLEIKPPASAGVSVVKSSKPPDAARVGSRVVYIFEVANTGDLALTLAVEDDVLGSIASGVNLAPGARQVFQQEFVVPENAPDVLQNDVKAVGTTADGNRVAAVAQHRLRVERGEPIPPDDFEVIEGIGPTRAKRLREAGVTTFAALAEFPIERLQEMFANVGDETLNAWREEARRLAGG